MADAVVTTLWLAGLAGLMAALWLALHRDDDGGGDGFGGTA